MKKIIINLPRGSKKALREINLKLDKIMSTQTELAAQIQAAADKVTAVTTQIQKIGTETSATLEKVTALNEQVAALQKQIDEGADLSDIASAVGALQTATAAALAQAQATDDLIPDAPETPAEPAPAPDA